MKRRTFLWLISVLVLCSTKTKGDNLKCGRSKTCQCFNNSDHYEYQCSKNGEEEIIIHVYPQTMIRIDCTTVKNFTAKSLPEITIENIKRLEIRYCPLPDNGLKEIVEHFGMRRLEHLTFEFGIFNNFTLPSDKFKNITDVTVLRIRGNDLVTIEDGFFNNFPSLLSLELDRNQLNLDQNTLSPLMKLKFFSLSDNRLQGIPDGLFETLGELEKLNLWKNSITKLDSKSFNGLKSLKSLELAYNHLEEIEDSTFDHLYNLVNISIRSNSLKTFPRKLFESNHALQSVEASGNLNLNVEDQVFSNFEFLKNVDLSNTKLIYIPEGFFENSTALRSIYLDKNQIHALPKNIFTGLKNLNKLSLGYNLLGSLQEDIFEDLILLETLDLQHNKIDSISENIFKPLINLRELNLNYNNIKELHLNTFIRNERLIKLSMRYNNYSYENKGIYYVSPFNKLGDLREIDLSHNEIVDFPEDLMLLASMRTIDLSWNNISYLWVNSLWKVTIEELKIDLQHNSISTLNFQFAEITALQQPNLDAFHNAGSSAVIQISDNPIICDCSAIDFIRYIHGEMYPGVKTAINFLYDNVQCASPDIFKNIYVKDVTGPMLTCPMQKLFRNFSCTNLPECECVWRPYDKTVIIDCQERNLTTLPEIYHPKDLIFNQTEVHLERNFLKEAPSADDVGYSNVSKLYLGNNLISEVDWIPPRLEVLDLQNNELQSVSYNFLALLNTSKLEQISLNDNPWKCVCESSNFTNFLRQHVHQINTTRIFCKGTSKPLINLNEKDLCPHNSTIYLASATVFILLLCIASCLTALYYKFQQEIKVWMYAHNICLFLIEEEELDKDKIYDAFLSYSHKDQDFVIENLISILEGGPDPYKLCIHVRNWIPGEFIATQVNSSVRDSKRTLVVLSPNFLESVWGKLEFRTAHTEAMKEGRARVIIVLYGDVDIESLDDELKAYMKTNTYIKWGDPWFWDKLKYALPHSKNRGRNLHKQKHTNMMNFIDDKFSLINGKKPSHFSSTISIPEENMKKMDYEEKVDENPIIQHEIV